LRLHVLLSGLLALLELLRDLNLPLLISLIGLLEPLLLLLDFLLLLILYILLLL